MPAEPVLQVRDLTKTYGSGDGAVTAVDDVSFGVESGSVLGYERAIRRLRYPVDLLTIAPLVVVTITPVVGVGYALGGLALLYKRIESGSASSRSASSPSSPLQ